VGEGEQFQTIAEAVAAAHEGDSVLVHAGTYPEQVEITQLMRLEAFGDGPVVIDGGCARENAIRVPTGSGITLSGMQLQNTTGAAIKVGDGPDGLPRPSHLLIEGMTITDFNCEEQDIQALAGIAVWYSDCCLEIRDNVIHYRTEGDPHGRGNGIWFKSNSERPSGGGHVIAGNAISGGWDGIGGENETDPHGTFDRDSTIEGNRIRDCWDDGIQVEGGNANVTVRGNYITRCGSGIAFAPTLVGPLYVEGNTIRDLRTGLYENQFCFKVGNAGDGVTYLTDNVCETEGDGISQTNSGVAPIVSRGNCFRVTRLVWELGDAARMDFDGDTVWSSGREHFIEWGDQRYASLREFQDATGHELTGAQSSVCPTDQAPPQTSR
jgi:parallel beta-helix repeat protein